MTLTKGIIGNTNLRESKLVMAMVVIAVEVLIGVLCLVTGFHVFPLFFGSLLVLLIFLYPKIGAIMMLFFMPGVEHLKYDIGTVSITPLRILLVPTLIGLILHILVHRSAIKMAPIDAPVVALISVAVLSILQSSNLRAGLIRLIFFLSLFLITFVLAQLLDHKKWVEIAIGAMVVSSVILITLVLTEAYFGYRGLPATITGGHRLMGREIGTLYGTAHALALDLNTYLPFVLLLTTTSAPRRSLFLILLASSFVLGIVLAAAMAGWLATIGSLTVVLFIMFARKQYKAVRRVLKRLIPVILLGSILAVVAVPSGLLRYRINRFLSVVMEIHVYTERTEKVRVPVWMTAKRVFYDHPIFGVGLGSMPIEYHKYMVSLAGAEVKEFAHHGFNVFVDIGTEMGMLGIGVFVWFIIAYARHVLKYLVLIRDPFLANMLSASSAACVAVFIQMQTETGPFWANNFWCLLGLSLAIINVAKAKGSEIRRGKKI